jgi:hypothetical protein
MNQTAAKSAFIGVYNPAPSPFKELDENGNIVPFSFKNIFKKKEKTEKTSSSSTADTSKNSGKGIGAGILAGIAGLFTVGASLAPILPEIGIGSKSRIAETNATAAANTQILNAQNQLLLTQQKTDQEKQKLYILAGVGLFMLIIIVVVFMTKK